MTARERSMVAKSLADSAPATPACLRGQAARNKRRGEILCTKRVRNGGGVHATPERTSAGAQLKTNARPKERLWAEAECDAFPSPRRVTVRCPALGRRVRRRTAGPGSRCVSADTGRLRRSSAHGDAKEVAQARRHAAHGTGSAWGRLCNAGALRRTPSPCACRIALIRRRAPRATHADARRIAPHDSRRGGNQPRTTGREPPHPVLGASTTGYRNGALGGKKLRSPRTAARRRWESCQIGRDAAARPTSQAGASTCRSHGVAPRPAHLPPRQLERRWATAHEGVCRTSGRAAAYRPTRRRRWLGRTPPPMAWKPWVRFSTPPRHDASVGAGWPGRASTVFLRAMGRGRKVSELQATTFFSCCAARPR